MAEQTEQYKKSADSKLGVLLKVAEIIHPGVSQDTVQSYYNEWPANYEKDMAQVVYRSPEVVAEHLAEYLGDNKDAKIVDVCAGTGRTAMRLHQLGYTNLTALDGNSHMLEEAKKKNIYKDTIQSWIGSQRLPIPDDTYDGLCISGAFYEGHLKPDCLLELIRIMKPGGHMVFMIPELNLLIVEAFRNKMEPEMKLYEDKGLWRMMLRKIIPDILEGMGDGVLYCFMPQPGKKIIGTGGQK